MFHRKSNAIATAKGTLPYDYVDFPVKLQETQLPPLLDFDNMLTGESIIDDCTHVKQVWLKMCMVSLGEYYDLYLLSDTLQNWLNFETYVVTIMN